MLVVEPAFQLAVPRYVQHQRGFESRRHRRRYQRTTAARDVLPHATVHVAIQCDPDVMACVVELRLAAVTLEAEPVYAAGRWLGRR
jgi:hypothetical protein